MFYYRYFLKTWTRSYKADEWVVGNRLNRTNNVVEGTNTLIKEKFKRNPNAYIFLRSMHDFSLMCYTNFIADRRKPRPVTDRSKLTEPLVAATRQLNRDNNVKFFLLKMASIH